MRFEAKRHPKQNERAQKLPPPDALCALQALRKAAGMGPEHFPIQAFVGMISDEVEALRGKNMSDDDIASIIRANSPIEITGAEITENYATPEERHQHGH